MPDVKQLEEIRERVTRELKEVNDLKEKHKYIHSAGYSPRCSICNHKKIYEIEQLREEGYTLEEIKQELELEVSIMSLSRHFKNHRPKTTEYKIKQELLMLDKVLDSINEYPFLEDYFRSRDLIAIDKFLNKDGFCTDCFRLCNKINPGIVTDSEAIQDYYNERIKEEVLDLSYSYYRYDFIRIFNYMKEKDHCINCRDRSLNDRLNILEMVIAANILNLEVDPKELIYLLYNKYDNDIYSMMVELGVYDD